MHADPPRRPAARCSRRGLRAVVRRALTVGPMPLRAGGPRGRPRRRCRRTRSSSAIAPGTTSRQRDDDRAGARPVAGRVRAPTAARRSSRPRAARRPRSGATSRTMPGSSRSRRTIGASSPTTSRTSRPSPSCGASTTRASGWSARAANRGRERRHRWARRRSRTGSAVRTIVVAVIDDGIDLGHPDLAARAWTNPGEAGARATNGVDDDGNGYVDDVHGWDFCNDDNTRPRPRRGRPRDARRRHDRRVARRHRAWSVSRPASRSWRSSSSMTGSRAARDDMAIEAIDYAASFGVADHQRVVGRAGAEHRAGCRDRQSGALFVAAAGNGGQDLDRPGGAALLSRRHRRCPTSSR